MRIFWILLISIFPFFAAADIPQADYSNLKEGAKFVYERTDGSRYAAKLTSINAGKYIFEVRNGEGGDGSFISRSTFTVDGKRLQWEGPEDTWVYIPHGCNREIGDCTYKTKKSTGGKSYRNTISAKQTNGRVTWKRYYNGNVVGNGWYEVDPNTKWTTSFSWSSTSGGGETAKLLRVEQP